MGTVEGTAALIKAPPKLGAGSFTLGMPADEAVARMKADGMTNRGAGLTIGFTFDQLPDHPLIGGAAAARNVPSGAESVGLLFTMYPNPPVVSGISRTLNFTPQTAPNVGNTLAALHKKYGPESASHATTLYWIFDYQGHPLSREQLAEAKKIGCPTGGPAADGGDSAYNIVDKAWMSGKISRGYAEYPSGGLAAPSAFLPCFSTVRVVAYLKINQPGSRRGAWGNTVSISKPGDWERASNALVENLTVTINDIPLDYSASTVSRNTVLNGGATQQQKQRDAAEKRKPSL